MAKRYLPLELKIKVAEYLRDEIEQLPDVNGKKFCRYVENGMTDAVMAGHINDGKLEGVTDWHVRSIRQQVFGRLRKPKKEMPDWYIDPEAAWSARYAETRIRKLENDFTELQGRLTTLETIAEPFRNSIYDIQKLVGELKTRENAIEQKIEKIVNGPTPWELK